MAIYHLTPSLLGYLGLLKTGWGWRVDSISIRMNPAGLLKLTWIILCNEFYKLGKIFLMMWCHYFLMTSSKYFSKSHFSRKWLYIMLIKNLLKYFLKFCFRILKDKRWMYNISDWFQEFGKKGVKILPNFQVKIRFVRNRRVKLGKPGLPGIKILIINSY